MELTEFLLARIAEDEAWANALMGERWFQGRSSQRDMPKRGLYLRGGETHLVDLWDANAATHIARHDPARVLAECEAKRRIVEGITKGTAGEGTRRFVLSSLALPYADHPGFDPAWRP